MAAYHADDARTFCRGSYYTVCLLARYVLVNTFPADK
jgi:hypothetical protein